MLIIIGVLKGIRAEEIASIMMLPTGYIDEFCQTLLKDGAIIKTAKRDGFALRSEARDEVLQLIKLLRVAYIREISDRLAIPPETALDQCESLLGAGLLHETFRGGYVLNEDRERVLRVIRQTGKTTVAEISKKMNVSEAYAELLCKSLTGEYSALQTSSGEYLPADKDVTRLLRLARKHQWVSIGSIAQQMGITSAYARLLCTCLIEQGYLMSTHPGGCSLARVSKEEGDGSKGTS